MSAAAIAKARETAPFAHGLLENLLAASSDFTTPEQKRHHMAKVFESFELISARMDQLRLLAPNSYAEGTEGAACLRELAGDVR